ncbi:cupin domain-containing protein [Spirosoma endbachense]|uniref:Cupin domain-containing protein n=1 Tax=Spirosoma endbachense TaxID=2666025 RepID=A0A6P1VQ53_9BACT|nr:cupin domain-containing protein [Spirosoma endbachense]QHV93729.1 cupin domain-containing protein [Spirosoma endbachense]
MRKKSDITVSINNAEHYVWGDNCDGWHLVKSDSLSIIQERMPPGTSEVKHFHQKARQFFFVLSGEATLEIGDKTTRLTANEGVEIPPLVAHKMRNDSSSDLVFTVTSMPKSHGDRVVVE